MVRVDETELERWRAAIGWNAEYYLRRFKRIAEAGGWAPGWNMAAFLNSTGWFWYRRMFGWALLNLGAPFVLLFVLAITKYAFAPLVNLDYPVLIVFTAYLIALFVLVPMFADSIYYRRLRVRLADAQSKPRSPSVGTAIGGIAFGGTWFALGLLILLGLIYTADHKARLNISWAIVSASGTRDEITEFHARHRRLPGPQEARQFRTDSPLSWVENVVYEPAERRIVITLREIQPGKRFALYAHESGGQLVWTCRTIDLEKKYLPATCRDG